MKYSILLFVFINILLQGCILEKDNDSSEFSENWKSQCHEIVDEAFYNYVTTLTDNTFSSITRYYYDSSCTITNSTPIYSNSGTYTISGEVTISSGVTARKIDVIILKEDNKDVDIATFDLISIISGKLYLGLLTDTLDSTSANKRPIDLDFNDPRTKI